VAEVTRRLVQQGWKPEVHAPRGPTGDGALAADVPLRRYGTFLPFVGTPDRRRALVANAGNIASLDEPLRLWRDRGLALSHLHTTGRIGGGVRTAMRMSRRPYVVSVHGPMMAERQWLEQDTQSRLAGTLDLGKPIGLLLGARRVLDDAARVISFNEDERVALAARVGDRSVRMDHGVDLERLGSGELERARERWPELARHPLVVVVGRLCAQKNQLLAVRAFGQAAPPDHQLVLAGAPTDRGYQDKIETLARELGVAGRVHILGNLDSAEAIPDLYALARLVLVPSTHEAFGLIVLEGWAAGRPVLFGRHSGLADIARALALDGATVPSMEESAWAEALRRHLQDEGLRQANAERGAELVRARYSWDRVAAHLSELYREVLEENRGSEWSR
jgi:glycosyltransferase involved in cell wall biosynthesis